MGIQQSICSTSDTLGETEAYNKIEFDGSQFIVPPHFNFNKQATLNKIQAAAKSFCNANQVNVFYYPLITRMIAYRREKMFLAAWCKLPQSKREDFLQDLSHVQHDLMDSFYHHYFKKDKLGDKPKRSLKTSVVLIPNQVAFSSEKEVMVQLGKNLLSSNKVALVLMCAGYSSRFDKEDKFLCPINLYEKVTILDLMFRRLRKNLPDPSQMTIIVNCNEMNRHKIEKHFALKSHYGFSARNISFATNFALPIFNESGEYCFDREVNLIKRCSGTINCAEHIFTAKHYQAWKLKGIEYVYVSGAENLLENPCDPAFLGRLYFQNKKAGGKCVKPQYFSEAMRRYYSQSQEYVKILESSNFEQVGAAMMDNLPIAMNSMVFEVQTLRRVVQDYASNISLAQYYQQLQVEEEVYNFQEDNIQTRNCYNFEKDIRYLLTCVKDPLLFRVSRGSDFAPIYSKNGQYSFYEAVNYYKNALSKQLAELQL